MPRRPSTPGPTTCAEGDFLVKKQEVNLLRLKVRDEWLEVHRKELEHWEWVRDFRAAAFINQLDRERKTQVEYNRRVPQLSEIITGAPLNSLCKELELRPELPAAGSTTIDEECLLHINLTVSGRGNAGMLKGDKILWPRLLLRAKFADDRQKIEDLLTRGKKLALGRKTSQEKMAEVLDGLEAAVRTCQARLDQEIRAGLNDADCNPCHWIETNRFLKEVVDATFILKRSDAATYFEAPEGKTVADLVAYMKMKGLHFAPAAVDDERYYVALHRALADEVTRLKNQETPSSKP